MSKILKLEITSEGKADIQWNTVARLIVQASWWPNCIAVHFHCLVGRPLRWRLRWLSPGPLV